MKVRLYSLIEKSGMLLVGLILCAATASDAAVASLEITVAGNPSLPLENLVKNGGFEDGMKSWSVSGQPDKAAEQGWNVELSKDTHQGNGSLHVQAGNKAAGKTPGVWQNLKISNAAGKSYIISCWVKAGSGVTNVGGAYCGAGASAGLYSSDWKTSVKAYARAGNTGSKWVRAVSKPIKAEDWCKAAQMSAGLSYTAGEAWIDDISVTEAYVQLTISVKGHVKQLTLEDETGNICFDSDPLDGNAGEYSKSIQVQAAHTYTIKALGKDGVVVEKSVVVDRGADKNG
ncbi:MAG: carbohydrate binding domain-containing protein [bacterium]|nr:carbohydrate binding domain-containing protein [bacterium]